VQQRRRRANEPRKEIGASRARRGQRLDRRRPTARARVEEGDLLLDARRLQQPGVRRLPEGRFEVSRLEGAHAD
jgi:hypothetical protein